TYASGKRRYGARNDVTLPKRRSVAADCAISHCAVERSSVSKAVCVTPWQASSWPAVTTASTLRAYRSATSPVVKNVAGTLSSSKSSSRAGPPCSTPRNVELSQGGQSGSKSTVMETRGTAHGGYGNRPCG